jgi:hypothetical protein
LLRHDDRLSTEQHLEDSWELGIPILSGVAAPCA